VYTHIDLYILAAIEKVYETEVSSEAVYLGLIAPIIPLLSIGEAQMELATHAKVPYVISALALSQRNYRVMKKPALTASQRQKRHQWKKKHRLSLNEDRQRDTIQRISTAAAKLKDQSFPSQTQALAALTEMCYQTDCLKPSYTTFKKHESLWIHLIEGKSINTQSSSLAK
jgi:hypothetical protein